ncbi:MAG: amino acid adenylation domain-containing protein, partial [bacterium]|nr:amino acid adenylation domain-containing protein [bacterium]
YRFIEDSAQKYPQNIAVMGPSHTADAATPPDGSTAAGLFPLTYRELNAGADGLAACLMEKGVADGSIVAVLATPSVEMVTALLAVSKSGGAYLPIDPAYPGDRIRYMLEDSNAQLLLTTRATGMDISFSGETIHMEDLARTAGKSCADAKGNKDSPAYIIYTSGSTGRPKAVAVEHRNLTAYINAFENQFTLDAEDVVIQQASFAFDAFVEEYYPILLKGGKIVIPGRHQVLDIEKLADFIALHNVTMITCSPLMLNQLNRIAMENDQRLDSIRIYISGGDLLKKEYIETLMENADVYNTYGPTEGTVCASYYHCRPDSPAGVPIGKPIGNYKILILDNCGNLLPVGLNGELCIGGPGVARGYLNKPQLTAEQFVLRHFFAEEGDAHVETPTVRGDQDKADIFYRTGDRALWLADGNIRFTGRLDSQVSIRGFRIEPGEIENQLSAHIDVGETVVIDRHTKSGDTYLCAYIVPAVGVGETALNIADLKEFLAGKLPPYMIPSFFVVMETIPTTTAGKVDRRALPEPKAETGKEFCAPTDAIENQLAEIWTGVLEINKDAIDVHADFFDLGGHSLNAVSLVNTLHKAFNVKLEIQSVFKAPTLAAMATLIRGMETDAYREIQPLTQQESYELSYTQKRIWLLHQLNPESTAFNIPGIAFLGEVSDEALIRRVVGQLILRHDAFRTCFKEQGESVVQEIEPADHLLPADDRGILRITDLTSCDEAGLREAVNQLMEKERATHFQLDKPPLFRVQLVRTGERGDIIIFNMHHLISDGWSLDVLQKDFMVLFQGFKSGVARPLPPLRIQYRDYANWHNRLLEDETRTEAAVAFWKEHLSSGLPLLDLPYDFQADEKDDKSSAGYRMIIPGDVTRKLRAVASDNGASPFMVLLAGFTLLLGSLRGAREIVMGIPGAARRHEDLKGVIGLFVNTLILKNSVRSGENFQQFLQRVMEGTLKVLEYQDFPMEMVCDRLKIKYPDLNVFFNMINIGGIDKMEMPQMETGSIDATQDTKFDLTFYVYEYRNGISITCNYFKRLFKPSTVESIMGVFSRILNNIAQDPYRAVGLYHKSGKKKKLRRG